MSYNDGIRVGGKHSFEDFGLVFNSREIGYPEKQSIRKTVPFMNGFYDYTKLYGEPAWGERIISYTFDVIGFTVEEMEAERVAVVNWLCNVHDEDIFDDAFPDYHFHGSFDSISPSEDGEQATITFSFVCYPFMIENVPRSHTLTEDGTLSFVNDGQPAMLKVATTGAMTVSKDGVNYGVPAGSYDVLVLGKGTNDLSASFKNELVYPFQEATHTEAGITYTDNGDGSITINGTATDISWFYIRAAANAFIPAVGKHYLRGIPSDMNGKMRLQVYAYDGSSGVYYYDNGEGGIVEVAENTQYLSIAIRIASGVTVDNLTITPVMHGTAVFSFAKEVL